MAAKKQPDLITIAFDLIAEEGWRSLSMTTIAARSKLPLDKVYGQLSGKSDVIRQFANRMDTATFSGDVSEMDELTAKERLFELLMRRFDALKPYRAAFLEVEKRRELDCMAKTALFCRMDRLAERLLDACQSSYTGVSRRIVRRLLMAAYAKVFSVWLKDDSEDLALTMSELDKRLGQLETIQKFTKPFAKRGRHRGGGGASEEPVIA